MGLSKYRLTKVLVIFTLLTTSILWSLTTLAQEVWLNSKSGVYHCPGTQWFQNTKSGKFIKESEAKTLGYRPAYGRNCFQSEVDQAQKSIQLNFQGKKSIEVWVNSKAHVYHCPGSRYFLGTKSGYLEDELLALEKGNRPAYGKPCQ